MVHRQGLGWKEDRGEDVKGKRETEKRKEGEKEGVRGRRRKRSEKKRMREQVDPQRQTDRLAALSALEQPRSEGLVLPRLKLLGQQEVGKGRGWCVVAPGPHEACKHCFSSVSSPDASAGLALFKAETHTIFPQSH